MRNTLKDIESGDNNFFIMVSYITTTFESNSINKEYFIYDKKKNGRLTNKSMNRLEIKHFLKNKQNYIPDLECEHGFIYVLKHRPYIKSTDNQAVTYVQLKLSFND